jgi:hypothetical protein
MTQDLQSYLNENSTLGRLQKKIGKLVNCSWLTAEGEYNEMLGSLETLPERIAAELNAVIKGMLPKNTYTEF